MQIMPFMVYATHMVSVIEPNCFADVVFQYFSFSAGATVPPLVRDGPLLVPPAQYPPTELSRYLSDVSFEPAHAFTQTFYTDLTLLMPTSADVHTRKEVRFQFLLEQILQLAKRAREEHDMRIYFQKCAVLCRLMLGVIDGWKYTYRHAQRQLPTFRPTRPDERNPFIQNTRTRF